MPRFPERFLSPVLAAATVALAACSGETPSLSEAVETEVSASAVTIPDGVERFILAQGEQQQPVHGAVAAAASGVAGGLGTDAC